MATTSTISSASGIEVTPSAASSVKLVTAMKADTM